MKLKSIDCSHCGYSNRTLFPSGPTPGMLTFCVHCRKPAEAVFEQPLQSTIYMLDQEPQYLKEHPSS